MTNEQDRYRNQDPDDQYSSRDEVSSSMDEDERLTGRGGTSDSEGGYTAEGGRFSNQDDDQYSSGMDDDRPRRGGKHARRDDDARANRPDQMDESEDNW
ncbi:hypothetical protein [Actinomadura rubrisoli]|uniref:Uncharacterized protein n=1 Tax=Actinomadura rubrisoli TaxID=2530368 RepID=A0A4R5AT90_9ACTN|nr:hypothetical protein [Actinomadura rubrisoli]TDD76221.1 hypothetical protein E1298_30960 [Actinomadura rubrisoli]